MCTVQKHSILYMFFNKKIRSRFPVFFLDDLFLKNSLNLLHNIVIMYKKYKHIGALVYIFKYNLKKSFQGITYFKKFLFKIIQRISFIKFPSNFL